MFQSSNVMDAINFDSILDETKPLMCKLEVVKKPADQVISKSIQPKIVNVPKCPIKENVLIKGIDEESQMGHFGWPVTESDIYSGIPYILRGNEKYFVIRMIKMKPPISNYLHCLRQDIYSHYTKLTLHVTEAEARLLNEINKNHCDYKFGQQLFTTESLLIKCSDAYALYEFLDTCYKHLAMCSQKIPNKIGFIQFDYIVVPFVYVHSELYMPLHCFSNTNHLEIDFITGWDLAYMKFCCLYQGTWKESSDIMAVVSLTTLKAHLPINTQYEICWPNIHDHELIKLPPKVNIGCNSCLFLV